MRHSHIFSVAPEFYHLGSQVVGWGEDNGVLYWEIRNRLLQKYKRSTHNYFDSGALYTRSDPNLCICMNDSAGASTGPTVVLRECGVGAMTSCSSQTASG